VGLLIQPLKEILLSLIIVVSLVFHTSASENISNGVNYEIKARLETKEKVIIGEEIITWTNMSLNPLSEIYINLYMNAYRNKDTLFMKEFFEDIEKLKGKRARDLFLKEARWGQISIQSIQLKKGNINLNYVEVNETVVRVKLPRLFAPKETISLRIKFLTKLPQIVLRTGYIDDFYLISLWYPKLAAFHKDEWKYYPFHPRSEFFSNFGSYKVWVTVPENFIVGASAECLDSTNNQDGTRTLYFFIKNIHDFVWAASPNFKILTSSFGNSKINFLYQRATQKRADEFLQVIRDGLLYLSKIIAPYPYPIFTFIEPPSGIPGATGIEFPLLITASLAPPPFPLNDHILKTHLYHEISHQYWYGVVGNNELEDAWLDEGLASYYAEKLTRHFRGNNADILDTGKIKIGFTDLKRAFYIMNLTDGPTKKYPWEFKDWTSYYAHNYAKPSLLLMTIENYFGGEELELFLKKFYEKWKFNHPGTEDWFSALNRVFPKWVNNLFQSMILRNDYLDYEVIEIKNVREESGAAKILVRNNGKVFIPVTVRVFFADGSYGDQIWDPPAKEKVINYQGQQQVLRVVVDPERKIIIDINYSNNQIMMAGQNDIFKIIEEKYLEIVKAFSHCF